MVPSQNANSQNHNTERPTLKAVLTLLDRDRLQTLILRLAERDPHLIEVISEEIARLPVSSIGQAAAGTTLPSPADIAPEIIRKSMQTAIRSIMRGGYDYDDEYGGASDIEQEVTPWLDAVRAHILAGDSRGVFPALTTLTEELMEGWEDIQDQVGDMSDLFAQIGKAWAEALLTAALSDKEREEWAETLEAWQENGGSSGAFSGLAVAVEAANCGWDDPPLIRVLQGEITEQGVWEGEPPNCAAALALIRLDILERQGRLQEAIYLAEAEGETERHLDLLVKAGRPQEALEKGLERISTPDQALRLAQSLAEHDEPDMALTIAERGLDLNRQTSDVADFHFYRPSKKPLADWLRDQALLRSRLDLAIRAAMVGLKEDPLLADYRLLQEIAGTRWVPLRQDILDFLHDYQGYADEGIIDILLLEERRDDALRLIEKAFSHDLVKRVLDACLATHPDQVVATAKRHAEGIMNAGKAHHYDDAAEWLKRVRDAYRASERTDEWQTYRNSLLATHGRKYKLVPMIRAL
jgi:uncharacterized Zn finger protein